jgi:hypothetical protein
MVPAVMMEGGDASDDLPLDTILHGDMMVLVEGC